jgi:hypothetical protein
MAKDGTNRGGARPGAGRKKNALGKRLIEGNPGKRDITVLGFDTTIATDSPEVRDFMTAEQSGGEKLLAAELLNEIWTWIAARRCEKYVQPLQVEAYAMTLARWIQCENVISVTGFLGEHPTTGAACRSPFVDMAQTYMRQAATLWAQIYQVIKENCATEYGGAENDPMERLLAKRRGQK